MKAIILGLNLIDIDVRMGYPQKKQWFVFCFALPSRHLYDNGMVWLGYSICLEFSQRGPFI